MSFPAEAGVRSLDVAVRAWAVPDYFSHRRAPRNASARRVDLGPSEWTLILDTETTTDLTLGLRVGCYQLRRRSDVRERGLFIERDALTDAEIAVIRAYAAERGLLLWWREEFVGSVFFPFAYARRALVVGFNLPFDLCRLAHRDGPAKDRTGVMRGGFTLTLAESACWPNIQLKKSGPHSTFIRFTIPDGRSAEQRNRERGGVMDLHRGYFLDVSQVATPMLGRRYSLRRLAELLDTEHRKLDDAEHGTTITDAYLDYLELDVQVTWECHEKLDDRYLKLGLTATPLRRIYSEASLGKAVLKETGLTPWRNSQPEVPDALLATIMETYYGGRSECLVRRSPRRGAYVDFTSHYPTNFVLQQLNDYLTATGIRWNDEDPAICQQFLDRLTVDDLLKRAPWRALQALVLVDPSGSKLPTRGRYRTNSAGRGSVNLAIAHRNDHLSQWYTLADCCASKLETGYAPRVMRVVRFRPLDERQSGMRAVDLAGEPEYRVDPARDDLVKRLVELRAAVRTQQRAAVALGDEATAARLDGIQQSFKVEANAIAYGIPIELNVTEHRRPVTVTVHLPDGSTYKTRSRRSEQPGRWFHPLLATLVASGGRLLLATAIAVVRERGGGYALCDTDSLFITDLGLDQVRDVANTFESLNPYDQELIPGSILKIEDENFDPVTREPVDLSCYAIAAKRYALFTLDEHGFPRLVGNAHRRRRSEHGLGHLRLPTHAELGNGPALDEWWEHLIHLELQLHHPDPDYFNQIAVGRLTVTTQHTHNSFRTYNRGRRYTEQVRPWSFGLIAHLTRCERVLRDATCLIAPHSDDANALRDQRWIDRKHSDRSYRITTDLARDDDTITVQTIRDYFNEYQLHTDAKMDGFDLKPCHAWTRGQLRPPNVAAQRLIRIGKESNTLADTNENDETVAFNYAEPICRGCGARINGRKKWCNDACRKRTGRLTKRP
jgi:hypothetical protein